MLKRLAYIILGLILLLIIPNLFIARLRDASLRLISPVGGFLIGKNNAITSFFTNLGQISTLREDKYALQEEVVALQQSLIEKETILRENTALRQELDVTGITRTFQKVFAHVIIRGNDPFDQTFTIDAGNSQGLKVGQPAIHQGALIGKVITVRDNSAIVRLITSNQSYIQAWISETREKGILVGDGNGVHLEDITQGVEVKSGAIIETSGLKGSLPQGILVGQTGELQSKSSDLSQKFFVTLSKNPTSVESVFILLTDAS